MSCTMCACGRFKCFPRLRKLSETLTPPPPPPLSLTHTLSSLSFPCLVCCVKQCSDHQLYLQKPEGDGCVLCVRVHSLYAARRSPSTDIVDLPLCSSPRPPTAPHTPDIVSLSGLLHSPLSLSLSLAHTHTHTQTTTHTHTDNHTPQCDETDKPRRAEQGFIVEN